MKLPESEVFLLERYSSKQEKLIFIYDRGYDNAGQFELCEGGVWYYDSSECQNKLSFAELDELSSLLEVLNAAAGE